jgi:hypothetical protein
VIFVELDIKDLKQQNMNEFVHSLEIVSARVLDSVTRSSQTACSATPEMQALFEQWVSFIGDTIVSAAKEKGTLDPAALAKEIGVTQDSVLSLILALHRQGRLTIKSVAAEEGNSGNREICGCLK